jgi:hypothetical protein
MGLDDGVSSISLRIASDNLNDQLNERIKENG